METTGVRRIAVTIVLSLIAAGIAVLNFGGGAIAQECGGGGSPGPSPSSPSPTPTDTGGGLPTVPTLPPLPGQTSTTSSPTPTNSTPGGGGSQETIECDSNISIRFAARTDTFRGGVTSDENVCERGRRVLLKRVKRGPDQTVGRTTTNRSGRWSIDKNRVRRGRYYAQTPARTVDPPGPGAKYDCGAARSRTIRAS